MYGLKKKKIFPWKPSEPWKSENYKSLRKALSFSCTLSFKTDSFHKPHASLNLQTFQSLFIFYILTVLWSREIGIYYIYVRCMRFFKRMEDYAKNGVLCQWFEFHYSLTYFPGSLVCVVCKEVYGQKRNLCSSKLSCLLHTLLHIIIYF